MRPERSPAGTTPSPSSRYSLLTRREARCSQRESRVRTVLLLSRYDNGNFNPPLIHVSSTACVSSASLNFSSRREVSETSASLAGHEMSADVCYRATRFNDNVPLFSRGNLLVDYTNSVFAVVRISGDPFLAPLSLSGASTQLSLSLISSFSLSA